MSLDDLLEEEARDMMKQRGDLVDESEGIIWFKTWRQNM